MTADRQYLLPGWYTRSRSSTFRHAVVRPLSLLRYVLGGTVGMNAPGELGIYFAHRGLGVVTSFPLIVDMAPTLRIINGEDTGTLAYCTACFTTCCSLRPVEKAACTSLGRLALACLLYSSTTRAHHAAKQASSPAFHLNTGLDEIRAGICSCRQNLDIVHDLRYLHVPYPCMLWSLLRRSPPSNFHFCVVERVASTTL